MRSLLTIVIGLFFSTIAYGQISESADENADPVDYIKKETIGGKLDFNLTLEKDNKGLYLYDGIAYNRKDFAIFLWGQSVKRLGVPSNKKALKLWTEINNRELTSPEKKALTKGFNTEIE